MNMKSAGTLGISWYQSWLENVLERFRTQIKTAVKHCFFAIKHRIVYTTRQLLTATIKDVLPASNHSNVIYQCLCHCDSRFVGRTSQRLQLSIKQHVPKSILQGHTSHDHRYPSRSSQSNRNLPETLDNIFCKTYHVQISDRGELFFQVLRNQTKIQNNALLNIIKLT